MTGRLTIERAADSDRSAVEQLRHAVYAIELCQYPEQPDGMLREDDWTDRIYLIARAGDELAGFVALTPPWAPRYAINKHMPAMAVGGPDTFEVQALTVDRRWRNGIAATALMYAALRWVAAHGGRSLIAMGRSGLQEVYGRLGLHVCGMPFVVGTQQYRVMSAAIVDLERYATVHRRRTLRGIAERVDWRLDVPMQVGETSLHGGRSFDAIGVGFDTLANRHRVIAADVLDAWFPPAPGVLAGLAEDTAWLSHTSPPVQAAGLRDAIARARNLPPEALVLGSGSSDLIYRVFPQIVHKGSRALVVRPTYGEYPHLLERVIGAQVDHLRLCEDDGWVLNLRTLRDALQREYDLVVLVNPANPTGGHVSAASLAGVLAQAPPSTWIWLDEAYVDYVGEGQSLESRAVAAERLIVCKSMSKVYGLSGQRVAYLVTHPDTARRLRRLCPPWPVSLPGQIAGVQALADPDYYRRCWATTHELRRDLARCLAGIDGLGVHESVANFVLVRLPADCSAAMAVRRCQEEGVYLRDLSPLSADFRGRYVRIAVRSAEENERIVAALGTAVRWAAVPR